MLILIVPHAPARASGAIQGSWRSQQLVLGIQVAQLHGHPALHGGRRTACGRPEVV